MSYLMGTEQGGDVFSMFKHSIIPEQLMWYLMLSAFIQFVQSREGDDYLHVCHGESLNQPYVCITRWCEP